MIVSREMLADIAKIAVDQKAFKYAESQKYSFYSGATLEQIKERIIKEFKNPDTKHELFNRLCPINIMRKIITKSARIYIEPPLRKDATDNEDDEALFSLYQDSMAINRKMMTSNRLYEIFKKFIIELYPDGMGRPRARALPPHTIIALSYNTVSENVPDVIVKLVKITGSPKEWELHVWSDESFWVIDGEGHINTTKMQALDNPEGANKWGVLPFVYKCDSELGVEPIPEDALYECSVKIPILLTDLSFGAKYQAWSLIYTVNAGGSIPTNPNTVVHLKQKEGEPTPSINKLDPTIQISETLKLIEAQISYLLSTRGLKTSSISGQFTTTTAESGISKAIDNSSLIEDKKNDQQIFLEAEEEMWDKINLLNKAWRMQGLLKGDYSKEFSATFKARVILSEPKVVMSESEQVDISIKRLEAGLSTLKMELKQLYPSLTDAEIDELEEQIKEESASDVEALNNQFNDEDNVDDGAKD